MLRVDDEQKEVRAINIGACKRIHLHGTLFEPFFNAINGVDV
jgi:hypothetical protein